MFLRATVEGYESTKGRTHGCTGRKGIKVKSNRENIPLQVCREFRLAFHHWTTIFAMLVHSLGLLNAHLLSAALVPIRGTSTAHAWNWEISGRSLSGR